MPIVLGLRTCDKDGKSYGGFQWPESGRVEAPDWNGKAKYGGGLHALLWGEGDSYCLLANDISRKWQVVAFDDLQAILLDGKVKFPWCDVVHTGTRETAPAYIMANGGAGKRCHFATSISGDHGTSTSGNYGSSTSGYRGTSTSGNYSSSTSGNRGTSTSGDRGTSTSGNYGTSISGRKGKVAAGVSGIISVTTLSRSNELVRCVGLIGKNGLEPNVLYRWAGLENGFWEAVISSRTDDDMTTQPINPNP